MPDIVHEYYRNAFDDRKVMIRLNPLDFTGLEITIFEGGEMYQRELEFDEDIHEDLKADGFEPSSPLEFNLHLNGFGKTES